MNKGIEASGLIKRKKKVEVKTIMIEHKTCPSWLHQKYREGANFYCQRCLQHETKVGKLIPHRIKRKSKGGLYTVVPLNHPDNNVKVVCKECHGLFHANDNRRIKTN